MQEVRNFAFDQNLVRVVLREQAPWFVGVDVCEALCLAKPENALATLDEDEKCTLAEGVIADGRGARARIIVSEPGVFRLVFRSRKPEAERFKRWLAHEVLPELRRTGRFDGAEGQGTRLPADEQDSRAWPVIQKLQCVQLCARIHGRSRAEAMWRQVGLPHVPPPPASEADQAAMCLRHLLDTAVHGRLVRDLVGEALEDDEEARAILISCGIRVMPERDAFVVANRHRRLTEVYAASVWNRPLGWMRVLRKLPGAEACGPFRFDGFNLRGTLLPGVLLGDE